MVDMQASMTGMLQKIGKDESSHLATMRIDAKQRVYKYEPPDWAKNLKGKPSSKIDLFQKFTPIRRWRLTNIPDDFEIYIKRDDMTGSALSGHKVRKLEFHFAEALEKDYKIVIGCGADVSNNCRSIAVAGKELGFHVHLIQYTEKEDVSLSCNSFISRMTGAQIHPVPEFDILESVQLTQQLAEKLERIEGQRAYILPAGLPGDPGIYGYIDAFHELVEQGVTKEFTDLVVSCGSGITTAAFVIGNYLTGRNLRIHALSTEHSKTRCQSSITNFLQKSGIFQEIGTDIAIEDLVSIEEHSREPRYRVVYDEHLDFMRETSSSTGILLDPNYTGKTAYHMVKMIQTSPNSFKGKKILFYNTGSFFAALSEDILHKMIQGQRDITDVESLKINKCGEIVAGI